MDREQDGARHPACNVPHSPGLNNTNDSHAETREQLTNPAGPASGPPEPWREAVVQAHGQEIETEQTDTVATEQRRENTKMKAPRLLTSLKFLLKFWALNETKRLKKNRRGFQWCTATEDR